MNTVRKKVIEMMTNTSTLSKLKNERWYEVEDAITNLICSMFGLVDNSYKAHREPTELEEYLKEKAPTPFMTQVYELVKTYHIFEDIKYLVEDEDSEVDADLNYDEECKTYTEEDKKLIYKYAHSIAHRYDDAETDWRDTLKNAINFVLEEKG